MIVFKEHKLTIAIFKTTLGGRINEIIQDENVTKLKKRIATSRVCFYKESCCNNVVINLMSGHLSLLQMVNF